MTNYDRAEALCNEGLELMMQQEWLAAEDKMAAAIKEDPDSPELWFNLGKCRFHLDLFNWAVEALDQATKLNPEYAEAWALMGSCSYAMGNPYNAQKYFGEAESWAKDGFIKDCATAYAHSVLAQGDYTHGFESYQYRLQTPDIWDGTQSLRGKTLLVKAEGGLGDQIFFSRYAPMLDTLGAGYVLWEVDAPLESYFEESLDLEVAVRGKEIPEHDYMVHAGSLPFIFGTKQGTIPIFDGVFKNPGRSRNIGLAWSGNPLQPNDHHRSIPLKAFEPLLALDKNFYLMQKDVRYTDKEVFDASSITPVDYTTVRQIADVVHKMDLVITVDTMTAHLAGAEGIPTWLLLPYAPDWRWQFEGNRTPWYPSVKIFRQSADRAWEPVIERVVEELNGRRDNQV